MLAGTTPPHQQNLGEIRPGRFKIGLLGGLFNTLDTSVDRRGVEDHYAAQTVAAARRKLPDQSGCQGAGGRVSAREAGGAAERAARRSSPFKSLVWPERYQVGDGAGGRERHRPTTPSSKHAKGRCSRGRWGSPKKSQRGSRRRFGMLGVASS